MLVHFCSLCCRLRLVIAPGVWRLRQDPPRRAFGAICLAGAADIRGLIPLSFTRGLRITKSAFGRLRDHGPECRKTLGCSSSADWPGSGSRSANMKCGANVRSVFFMRAEVVRYEFSRLLGHQLWPDNPRFVYLRLRQPQISRDMLSGGGYRFRFCTQRRIKHARRSQS